VDLSERDVLEVGSGRGGGASFIARYLHPAKMVGVDLSANAVDFSRITHPVKGLEFKQGDAELLPFESGSFDAIVNVESSHCYPSPEKFFSEIHRVLRKGGYFLYADFREAAGLDAWRRGLEQSGLRILREQDITAQVLTALDDDNERKLALIQNLVPRPLQRSFRDFAAVQGSPIYEAFRIRRLVYLSFVLEKTD
jgi:SAM-dependent methyltransferase